MSAALLKFDAKSIASTTAFLAHSIAVYRATAAKFCPQTPSLQGWADTAERGLASPDDRVHKRALGMICSELGLLCYMAGEKLGLGAHPPSSKKHIKAAELLGTSLSDYRAALRMDKGWPMGGAL